MGPSSMAAPASEPKLHLKQLDGLRGPLCIGVIAINMGLYNAGANTPVGLFLVLSGLTSFIAYSGIEWDDASRGQFFLRRLMRLLPMLLISTALQLAAASLWLFRRGVVIEEKSSGGGFSFVVTLVSFILTLAGAGLICRGTACGCCQIMRWPRRKCALFPLVLGAYLNGSGWYVGLLLLLQAYFLPLLMARYGAAWRAKPPPWFELFGWAALEGLQFGGPLLVYVVTQSGDAWFYSTLYLYLGAPPLFRLVTFIFGLQLGRWILLEGAGRAEHEEHRALAEARTLLPVLGTAVVVATLHGFLEPESELHRPDTGSTPQQWIAIHLIHPFNILALVCGLVTAPQSLTARLLASRPLLALADLSYALYLVHYAVITAYVFAFDKSWMGEWELLSVSPGAAALDTRDYLPIVLISAALSYPATHWMEPRVAMWLEARLGATTAAASSYIAL